MNDNETTVNIWEYPSDAEIERAEQEYLLKQERLKRRAAIRAFLDAITLRTLWAKMVQHAKHA